MKTRRYLKDGGMQLTGKGMGSVNQQTDVLLFADSTHRLVVERTIQPDAVVQRQFLFARLRAIVIAVARFIEYLDSLASFRCSSEYQYHICWSCD